MGPYKRILCPIDFSGHASAALREATALAKGMGAELTLLHAHQNPAYVLPMSGYVGPTVDLITRMREQLTAEMDGLADQVRREGITVHTQLLEGVAYKCIIDYADEWKADLIVMSTHGRTGLSHALTGSVAERVVRTAHCHVLITPGHE